MKRKELNDLKDHWYRILKDEGFKDIENFYHEESDSFRYNKFNTDDVSIKRSSKLSQEVLKTGFTIFQGFENYLVHGPFCPNILQKFQDFKHLRGSKGNFADFLASQDHYWNETDTICWQLYCEGLPYREISRELRRLWKLNKLSSKYVASQKRPPYSLGYVHRRINAMRAAADVFNRNDSEGSVVYREELQDIYENLPEANKPTGMV